MLTCTSERNQYPFEWIRTANNKNKKNKKYRVQGSRFRSNISETVRDIRVPFSLLARCKSHATKRCNPRLCSCYRFWDIVVANINNFPILLEPDAHDHCVRRWGTFVWWQIYTTLSGRFFSRQKHSEMRIHHELAPSGEYMMKTYHAESGLAPAGECET